MPCYYTGTAEGDANLHWDELSKALTKVTRLLCDVCADLEGSATLEDNPELKAFWNDHKEVDKKRRDAKRKEQDKKELEERRLLKQLKDKYEDNDRPEPD